MNRELSEEDDLGVLPHQVIEALMRSSTSAAARISSRRAGGAGPDDLGNNRATIVGPIEKVVAEGRFELPTKGL